MRLLPVLACLAVLVAMLAIAPQAQEPDEPRVYRVFLPMVRQPPWRDDPAKGVAGYLPTDALMRHHAQHQWNLTCSADDGIDCINHLKKRSTMDDLYPDRPALLTETLQACSGGQFWYGDEFNLYSESHFPMSQWVDEAHWIRGLFDQHAPDGCLFGFGVPILGWSWGVDGNEWIQRFDSLYRETYGEPLDIDIYLVDDYYRGPDTYTETVATHTLIRELYGDVQIVAREWGSLSSEPQLALDYACETGWHELYDRYFWFIGKVQPDTVWEYTALYVGSEITDLGRGYAAFPSWYCGAPFMHNGTD